MEMKNDGDEDEDDDESGEGGSERGRQREEREAKKRRMRRRGKTQTWTPNTYALARTTSQDHKRLLVPRSKQALSRRLQVPAPTKCVHLSWSITGSARNPRFWRARTPSICE